MARKFWELRADFSLVTPAFLAGAQHEGPDDVAELRPPSLIGALRFWWRALAWSRTTGDDVGARLAAIRRWEAALFGTQASETGGGQGAFVMRMTWNTKAAVVHKDPNAENIASLDPEVKKQAKRDYNNGYTSIDRKKTQGQAFNDSDWATIGYATGVWMDSIRACSINPGLGFSLHFRCFKDPGIAVLDEAPTLMAALKLLGLIGAVGSRSRRGFGSLALGKLTLDGTGVWACPAKIADYRLELAKLLDLPSATPIEPLNIHTPFTAIDSCSRALVSNKGFSQISFAHAAGLEAMREWRSWVFQKVQPVKQPDTHHDHDWFYENTGMSHAVQPPKSNGIGAPRKTGFGLPLKFFKPPPAPNAEILASPVAPTDEKGKPRFDTDRRASPLFLHVHKIGSSFVPVWVYLPTSFLPGMRLSITRWGKIGDKRQAVPLAHKLPELRNIASPYAATNAFVDHLANNGYTRVTRGGE